MPFRLTLTLLAALMALPAAAQTGVIRDTGPRYCPELADTDTPFRVICPSWELTAHPVNISTDYSAAVGIAQSGTPLRAPESRH